MNLKQKIIGIVVVLGIVLLVLYQTGWYGKITRKLDSRFRSPRFAGAAGGNDGMKNQNIVVQEIKIVSTNPSPLEESTILPTQTIELTFNQAVEGGTGEVKTLIEPKTDYKIELSDDRKTARVVPTKPYLLGQGYTLHILGNTKFEGKKELGREEIFHFKTISYSGV